jgi:flavin reductase (DIM6/NTAB) family NADH-FMN oxidoreductase RutF
MIAADTLINIRATREFVVNLVPFSAAQKMVVTSIPFPRGIQEPLQAGLTLIPSAHVSVPRIHESPVSLECTLFREIPLDDDFNLVLGRILMVHVRDEAVIDAKRFHIDALTLDLVGRMEGSCYGTSIGTIDRQVAWPLTLDGEPGNEPQWRLWSLPSGACG